MTQSFSYCNASVTFLWFILLSQTRFW